jgi:DNA primase
MACHLAGVTTAVATCGTSFGEDHIRVLRRLLMDSDAFNGEVVFLFDGDAAGQKAAMRAFSDDQKFVSQTFVAVESSGLDPCELRQQQGDEAVRALVERRVPLFEFAIKSVLTGHDLNLPAGRIAALRAAAPVVARIRDHSLRPEYARSLAGWLGMEVGPVQAAVTEAARAQGNRATPVPEQGADAALARPDPRDRSLFGERELLKLAVQHPELLGKSFDELPNSFFTHPAYRAVTASISGAGGIGAAVGNAWIPLVSDNAANDAVRSVITELAVEPLRTDGGALERYAVEQLARAEERVMSGRIDELRSRMQRLEGTEEKAYAEVFAELVHLEQERRKLHEQAYGSD